MKSRSTYLSSNRLRVPVALLVAHLCFLLLGQSRAEDSEGGTPTYLFEDFEQTVPGVWCGRPEALGTAVLEKENVHSGKAALAVTWNLKAAAGKDSNFVNFVFHRNLAGQPASVQAWVYADDSSVGAPLRLWLSDASDEVFITSAVVEKKGWQEISFPIAGINAAWKSGNADGKMDFPLKLTGISLQWDGHEGKLLVDDTTVTTTGTARELAAAAVKSEDANAIGWGRFPDLNLHVSNPSSESIKGLTTEVSIIDPLSGQVAWSKKLSIPPIVGKGKFEVKLKPEFANGAYDLKWKTSDAAGELPMGSGTLKIAKMMGDVSKIGGGPQMIDFVRKYSWLGGVFWTCTNERVAQTGGFWDRQGNTSLWQDLEKTKGELDFKLAVDWTKDLRKHNIDSIYFNTVYNQPKFYGLDQLQFAAAYGHLHRELAKALGNLVDWYEFGNEDNGPTKFYYTEVARHGAAAIRSEKPYSMLLNSGTAQIDVTWLKMQAARGLFDRLDVLVTHPYTWSSSPEEYDVLGQLKQVDGVIDDLGGMKYQLSTEFGYPTEFDQQKRADWTPRHIALAASAGLLRHGLYAYDNHFGIYENGNAFPVAVSINAFSNLTYGHRFAGWLRKDDSVWAAVFEKGGKPLLMAWSPLGKGSLKLEETAKEAFDLFGNPLESALGKEIALNESPVYFRGLPDSVVDLAWQNSADEARLRYRDLLKKSPLAEVKVWADLADKKTVSFGDIAAPLKSWKPLTSPPAPAEQAVIAQAVRWLGWVTRYDAAADAKLPVADTAVRLRWQDQLAKSVADDIDLPPLRWVLRTWERMNDEGALVSELGNKVYAGRLARLDSVFDSLSGVLAEKGEHVFFPVWPYVYASSAEGSPLIEKIQFIPGKAVPVQVRLNSYSRKSYPANLKLVFPAGWKCEPADWNGTIEPGSTAEVTFKVTASDEPLTVIQSVLTVEGKPKVEIPFNDFDVLPAFDLKVPVLSSLLPQAPLPINVTNNGSHDVGATIRVLEGINLPAVTRTNIPSVPAGKTEKVELTLPSTLSRPPFNEWKLQADVTTSEGKNIKMPLSVDFDVCVRATSAPKLDGDLSEWVDAAPLHIDKVEYTRGSYGNAWTPEDLSGTVYTMWDEQYFYIAVKVKDQLFNQNLSTETVWQQDSVQIGLGMKGPEFVGLSFALTPGGPQVWNHTASRKAESSKLSVKLNQGETVYEAAIPWSEFPEVQPKVGESCRFDVLLNDDDAIVNRRFMDRYGVGIVNAKGVPEFGYLHFVDAVPTAPSAQAEPAARTIFREDFAEYDAGAAPDVWVTKRNGAPTSLVQAGEGRDGSQALVLNSPNDDGDQYVAMTRPLTGLTAGKPYILRAWVKGSNIQQTGHFIGVCSDAYTIEGYMDVPPWKPSDEWQQVAMPFTASGGNNNVYIRNGSAKVDNLAIDDIEVMENN